MVFKKVSFEKIEEEFKCKLWIKANITVIEKAHTMLTTAHGGAAKTIDRSLRFFYWPKTQVQFCQTCK